MFRLLNNLCMWIYANLLSLSAAYLLARCNQVADELSRSKRLPRDWQIYKEVVRLIWREILFLNWSFICFPLKP